MLGIGQTVRAKQINFILIPEIEKIYNYKQRKSNINIKKSVAKVSEPEL